MKLKKIIALVLIATLCFSFTSCGLSTQEEIELVEQISYHCDHVALLKLKETASVTTESSYDIYNNTYTVYIINPVSLNLLNLQEHGDIIFDLETSMSGICTTIKSIFDTSELESENYDIIIHLTDIDKNIYITITNGLTTYSKWDN